jgi:hypothetical protein
MSRVLGKSYAVVARLASPRFALQTPQILPSPIEPHATKSRGSKALDCLHIFRNLLLAALELNVRSFFS